MSQDHNLAERPGNDRDISRYWHEWEFDGRERRIILCVETGLELRPGCDGFDSRRLDELIEEATHIMRASASPIDSIRIVPERQVSTGVSISGASCDAAAALRSPGCNRRNRTIDRLCERVAIYVPKDMEGHLPKSIYRIAFVERGQEDIWRKYWLRPTELSANARSANRNGALGRTDLVEASSLEEALAIVQGRHSNCSVMPERSEKVV